MAGREEIAKALEGRAWESGVIPTTDLIFQVEVADACKKNVCGKYDSCWTCPPGNGGMETLKAAILKYDNAYIFTSMIQLEDSFDIEGMDEGKKHHNEITQYLIEKFGKTNPVYGAGGCRMCEKCTYPQAPCRRPDKAVASIESAGINVTDLSRSAGVKYNNGEATVTYFSMILF